MENASEGPFQAPETHEIEGYELEEIGAALAYLSGISTKVDGSIVVKLEIYNKDQAIISRLLKNWSLNKRLIMASLFHAQEIEPVEG